VQVEGLTAIAVTGIHSGDLTSEKRKVGGSTPPLTTSSEALRGLLRFRAGAKRGAKELRSHL
jgi:hypothetical protein